MPVKAPSRSRPGFTMMEIVIALTIIAIMVAVIVPSMTTRVDQARITYMQTTLDNVLTGIRNYKTNVTRYPESLQQLSFPPDNNNGNDICGTSIYSNFASKWRGPYVSQKIGSANPSDAAFLLGLPLGDYIAEDLLVRTPTTSTTPGRLDIQVTNFSSADWLALNNVVDGVSGTIPAFKGDGSDSSGTVRYDVPTKLLSYGMPIAGC